MFTKDWEARWKTHTYAYIGTIQGDAQEQWLADFLQSASLLLHVSTSSIVAFVKEFKLTVEPLHAAQLDKKLAKTKKGDIERFLKVFFMDYLTVFSDNPANQALLASRQMDAAAFEQAVCRLLRFTKEDKALFASFQQKKNTVSHSVQLLSLLHAGKNARNDAFVEAVELIKEELYNSLDRTFQKFLPPAGTRSET